MDDEMLKLMARINISSYRLKTLRSLKEGDKIPSQIAKDADIRINHISGILKELKELDVVVCLNEEDKRNRVYRLTPTGRQIADDLD